MAENWPFSTHFGANFPIFRPLFPLFSRWGTNPFFGHFFPFRAGGGLHRAVYVRSMPPSRVLFFRSQYSCCPTKAPNNKLSGEPLSCLMPSMGDALQHLLRMTRTSDQVFPDAAPPNQNCRPQSGVRTPRKERRRRRPSNRRPKGCFWGVRFLLCPLKACFAIALAWHRGANWEIPESAPGSAPGNALRNRGALGGAPEGAQGNRGCSRECSRGCPM